MLFLRFCHFQDQKPLQLCDPDISHLGNLKNLFSDLTLKIVRHPGDKLSDCRKVSFFRLKACPCHHVFKIMAKMPNFFLYSFQILNIQLLLLQTDHLLMDQFPLHVAAEGIVQDSIDQKQQKRRYDRVAVIEVDLFIGKLYRDHVKAGKRQKQKPPVSFFFIAVKDARELF